MAAAVATEARVDAKAAAGGEAAAVAAAAPTADGLPLIDGLVYAPDFISAAEESAALQWIDAQPWDTAYQRRRQYYGAPIANAHYHAQDTAPPPIPPLFAQFAARLVERKLFHTLPDAVLVNEYAPGQGIAAHTDDPLEGGEQVCSLSLGSVAVIDYEHNNVKAAAVATKAHAKAKAQAAAATPGDAKAAAAAAAAIAALPPIPPVPARAALSVLLTPRSALVMEGDARYHWRHAIAKRTEDVWRGDTLKRTRRVSLTFRYHPSLNRTHKVVPKAALAAAAGAGAAAGANGGAAAAGAAASKS